MRGLILKDFINMKRQIKVYILLIVLWGAVSIMNKSGDFFNGVLLMIPVLAITTVMAYDDRYKWNGYALTMPVTRKDLIVSKYVFSFLIIAGVIIVSLIWQVIMGGNISDSFAAVLSIAAAAMIINGVTIPIFFYFGSEHGRIVFFAAVVIIAVVAIAISKLGFIEEMNTAGGSVSLYHVPTAGELALIILAGAVAVTALSVFVSVKIYENKEF